MTLESYTPVQYQYDEKKTEDKCLMFWKIEIYKKGAMNIFSTQKSFGSSIMPKYTISKIVLQSKTI